MLFYVISILVWIFPIIKQRKTDYMKYFLLLALADPIGIFIYKSFHFPIQLYALSVIVIMFIFLLPQKLHLKTSILGILLIITISIFTHDIGIIHILDSILLIAIISLLSLRFIGYLLRSKLNLFLALLLLYNIISLFRMVAVIFSIEQGAVSSMIGYVFQILFGILFTFININTKNFKLNLTYFEKRVE